MSTSPQISIVIPCYNGHEFLPRALDSLRAQTFEDFEIIVIDDGSTDPKTIAYLDTMPDDICLLRQENEGTASARNRGFARARAAHVLPLDCDDWIAPEFLADVYHIIQTAPKNSFVLPDRTLEDEASGVLNQTYNLFEQLFINQSPYCMLIPRSAWLSVGGYDPKMRGYEDWEFNIRLGLNGYRGIELGKPAFHYQVSSSGKLISMSRPHHIELWRYIRSKHHDVYTLKNLIRLWWSWRRERSVYPLYFYFLWEILARFASDRTMTKLFHAGRSRLYPKTTHDAA